MLIPAGEFMMGSADDDEDANKSERPQHSVQLTQFLMGATPVTQAQWRVVAGYDPVDESVEMMADPSRYKGANWPVEHVSWYQADEFCQRLSKRTSKHFHLPSEAQWEYACRAGTETNYHFGSQLTAELAVYESSDGPVSVGSYPPNRWGLCDMHGNVWEWCASYWYDNYEGAPTDGSAWIEGRDTDLRVVRGGSWFSDLEDCRSAHRHRLALDFADIPLGFRVICSPPRSF
ncbi:MAG: formylglycine-generating enzyme family protein [Leptolyngbya sp. SIO1E4]|nr:formylglycine-generating enzyme family protein [Leptolyngbya sp. SIO1E4]